MKAAISEVAPPSAPPKPSVQTAIASEPIPRPAPLFRRIDWLTFGITALVIFVAYYMTLAPDLTLEDSGELAVASFYAGVPHPPGYPLWTIITWLFTVLVPISNIAWRVALASATAGALSCGLLALMVSRGSSMMIEGISELKGLERRWENAICMVAGFVSGTLLGFNGFFWSQCVIVEVYPLSVLTLMGVLCLLLRWVYAPHQRRYLYLAAFLFGLCFTNHQTLIVAAMGLEVAIWAVKPKMGRDLFLFNSVIYLLGLYAKSKGMITSFDNNLPLFAIYNVIGVGSLAAAGWLTYQTRKTAADWLALGRDLLLCIGGAYVLALFAKSCGMIGMETPADGSSNGSAFLHLVGLAALGGAGWLAWKSPKPASARQVWWRNVFLGLSVLYFLVLLVTASAAPEKMGSQILNRNSTIFVIGHLLGFGSLIGFFWFATRTNRLGTEIKLPAILAGMWLLGASFYFYMPVTSMTNPPMNWGYPRTYDGFIHALTRGQYERTNPTNDVGKFIGQMRMYGEGAAEEFNFVYLMIGLVPFLYFFRMQKREQAWMIGLTAIFLCLAVLLMILLNPNTDKQSKDLTKVFFTASYVMIAMWIGYGLTLIGSYLATHYAQYRTWILYGCAGAAGIAIYSLAKTIYEVNYPLIVYTAIFGVALSVLALGTLLVARRKAPLPVMLAIFALMPTYSVMSHWADNEQHGHLFGFWFGHDMFTPPFKIYPEMARDAILFGGTDPGRFCPTYMIFCESFIPPKKRRDPKFDRRDVYIITQNALADGTYLNYIRAQYNRSTEVDPPFFRDLFRTRKEIEQPQPGFTNYLARAVAPVDRFFTNLGERIEARRRREGVYPPKEIHTPSPEESKACFDEYIKDAQKRLAANQLDPGENVQIVGDRVQVAGQVSVMQINGLLTKVIFDQNPTNEFYVEESFPLKWMYPHLEPFGIIMKIDRKPLPEITDAMVKKDHDFWCNYSKRLIGNWITYDTPIKDICAFTERVYRRMDFRNFTGDPKFVRDNDAQKAFSKLRSAIGGLYAWRVNNAKPGSPEQQRMFKEADFAFRQAFAFCPYSPEAVFRYVNLLASVQRFDDALMVAETCQKFDPENDSVNSLVKQLIQIKQGHPAVSQAQSQISELIQQYETNPGNVQVGLKLASALFQLQQTNQAMAILDHLIAMLQPQYQADPANAQVAFQLASAYSQRQKPDQAEAVINQLVSRLEPLYQASPTNAPLALHLVSAYLQRQEVNRALPILNQLIAAPNVDSTTLLSAAQAYAQLGNVAKLEETLLKLVKLVPLNPEAWYDLAALQAVQGKNEESIKSLSKSIQLSNQRLKQQPNAKNLLAIAAEDGRFQALRQMPEYKKLTGTN
ncbi:MAG: DUF2723 domain-containing protein [Candidatus Omnitrophica bacterium]|nr:DUF2723 domain-containing protein [Candidatus Omnitrophota bacterium]